MNKISIITATFNAEHCLEGLIQSIKAQKEAYEFIVIDGGSTDATLDIIKRNADIIAFWKSERDKGIYDAWNKGIEKATGDWIMFLGADDMLLPNALTDYLTFIEKFSVKDEYLFISSRRQMLDVKGNLIRTTGYPWSWPKFLEVMTVSHPGALHSRRLFEIYGIYNINYKISGDYELLLRPRAGLKAAFLDVITVKMSEGGASDSIRAVKEYYNASTKTGGNSKLTAGVSSVITILKFVVKKSLRKFGLNVYLQK